MLRESVACCSSFSNPVALSLQHVALSNGIQFHQNNQEHVPCPTPVEADMAWACYFEAVKHSMPAQLRYMTVGWQRAYFAETLYPDYADEVGLTL